MAETEPDDQRSDSAHNTRALVLGLVWILAVIAVLPALLHWTAPSSTKFKTNLAVAAQYACSIAICYFFYRTELKRVDRRQAVSLISLIFLLSTFTNNLHNFFVDRQSNYFRQVSNVAWQHGVQNSVIQMSPQVVPHSYRFLPNAIVRWIELAGVRFEAARDIYRALAGLALFCAIYRYARLYTTYLGSILTLLLVAAVYPISFEWYAGQLTDPLSHLSFVLAFIFLEMEEFPFLLTTLLLAVSEAVARGVLALSGFYVLFRQRERNLAKKAGALWACSLAMYFGVRMLVLKGTIHYQQVSGVSVGHILTNLKDRRWPTLFLITACAYIPFLVLDWKETPASLKHMALYLLAVLFVSSLVFSWLVETRNFMSVVFVLAVVCARFLIRQASEAPQ